MRGCPWYGVLAALLALVVWPAGARTNLLTNPGFEEAAPDGTPVGWNSQCTGASRAARETVGAFAGDACGHVIKVTEGESHVAAWAQNVDVTGDTIYLLSAMARGEASPGRAQLFCYEYGPGDTWIGCTQSAGATTESYRPVCVRIRTNPNTVRCVVRFEIYGTGCTGEGWVDDVYFGPPAEPPARPERVDARRTGQAVAVSWAPVAGATRYVVFRSPFPDTGAAESALIGQTADTSYEDAPPPGLSRCYYAVAAMGPLNLVGEATGSGRVVLDNGSYTDSLVVWTRPCADKVRPYTEIPDAERPRLRIELARNEVEAGQVLISARGAALSDVSVRVSPLRCGARELPAGAVSLMQMHYTRVHRPTLPDATPGLYPDPLPPLAGSFSVDEGRTQSIWVQVRAPRDCHAGRYTGTVEIRAGQASVEVPSSVTVFDFALPEEPSFMSAFAIWGNFVAKAHGVADGSPEHQALLEKYYWFMVDHRLPPDDPPVPVTSPEAARFLDDPRVGSFRIPVEWAKVDAGGLSELAELLRQKGWLRKGYVYCFDEPTPEQYGECRSLADQVHAAGEDVPMLLTEQPEDALLGAVDIWCPVLSAVDWVRMNERRAAGDRLWWYTCCGPQAPYPTYLVDDAGMSHRVLSWLQALHRIEGVLYWSVTVWSRYRDGKYEDAIGVWDEAEMFPNANGDGFLLYPGTPLGIDGPVTSARLELIRDGNEDFEYIALLRRLMAGAGVPDIEERVAAMVTPVASTFLDWTRDPERLQTQRRLIAREIERLSRLAERRDSGSASGGPAAGGTPPGAGPHRGEGPE